MKYHTLTKRYPNIKDMFLSPTFCEPNINPTSRSGNHLINSRLQNFWNLSGFRAYSKPYSRDCAICGQPLSSKNKKLSVCRHHVAIYNKLYREGKIKSAVILRVATA